MRRLAIDFARPSAAAALLRVRRSTWIVAGLAVVLAAFAAVSAQRQLARTTAEQRLADHARAAAARLSVARAAPKPVAVSPAQAAAVNAAVAQLNLPWGAVFDVIESVTPASIALIALEPDPHKRVLKGSAEARNAEDMLAYVEALKRQEFFHSVVLTRHEINEQDPNKPLRFQFEAAWSAP